MTIRQKLDALDRSEFTYRDFIWLGILVNELTNNHGANIEHVSDAVHVAHFILSDQHCRETFEKLTSETIANTETMGLGDAMIMLSIKLRVSGLWTSLGNTTPPDDQADTKILVALATKQLITGV